MLDGKSKAKLSDGVWLIAHKTGKIVFEYQTYQGNKKKAIFNSQEYAEQALQKYIRNPEDYYVFQVY